MIELIFAPLMVVYTIRNIILRRQPKETDILKLPHHQVDKDINRWN